MKVQVLKLKSLNSKTSRSWSFRGSLQLIDDSNDYVIMFAERQAQITEFVTGKMFKLESLVYQNKT